MDSKYVEIRHFGTSMQFVARFGLPSFFDSDLTDPFPLPMALGRRSRIPIIFKAIEEIPAELRNVFKACEGRGPSVQVYFHQFKLVNSDLGAIEKLYDLTASVAHLVTTRRHHRTSEKDAE